MIYKNIDKGINLLSLERRFSCEILKLDEGFINKANQKWCHNAYFLLVAVLGEVERLDASTEVSCVRIDELYFSLKNSALRDLEIELLPSIDPKQLPSISIKSGPLRKVYEASYDYNTNKLYLNLKSFSNKYSKDYDGAEIIRKLSNNGIFIVLNKGESRVEITIKRPKDNSQNHFILKEEGLFLKKLAALEVPFYPQEILKIFKDDSEINLSEVLMQMEFFSLSKNDDSTKKEKSFMGGIQIVNGQKRTYFSIAEKHHFIADPSYYDLPLENNKPIKKGENKMNIFNDIDKQSVTYPVSRIRLGFMEGISTDFTGEANDVWFSNSKKLIYNFLRILEPGFKITDSSPDDLSFSGIDKDGVETSIYLCPKGRNDLLPTFMICKNDRTKLYECGFDDDGYKMALNLKETQFKMGEFLITVNSSNNKAEITITGSNISFEVLIINGDYTNLETNLFGAISNALDNLSFDSSLSEIYILKILKAFKDSMNKLSPDFKINVVSKNANQDKTGKISIQNEEILAFEITIDLKEAGRTIFKLDPYNCILMPKLENNNQSADALEQRRTLAYKIREELNNL